MTLPENTTTPPSSRAGGDRLALRPVEAAKALGVSRATMYRLIESGEVRTKRIGRNILIPVAEVRKLVEFAEG